MVVGGVIPGSPIPLRAHSSVDFVVDYLAVHKVGAIALPYDPQISRSNWDWLNCQLSSLRRFEVRGEVDDPADIILTSGTTGQPKGVMLTHRNILAAARHINLFIGNRADDCELLTLPLYHSFGLGRLRCVLLQGGTLVIARGLVPLGPLFALIEEWQVTGLALVPTGVSLLLKVAEMELKALQGQLRYLEIGSASMERGVKEQLCHLLPQTRLCMHYGLTEGSRAAFLSLHEAGDRLDSIGRPSPRVEMQVVAPMGEVGPLLVRGEMVMRGYWGDEEATRQRVRGGWLWTGDLGWRDEEGYFYLSGREGEMIQIGGRKVAPIEIEKVLNGHPAIAESACIGCGEVIHAYLVSSGEQRISSVELTTYLRERLEPYKVPAVYSWVDGIPKTELGKIRRDKLIGMPATSAAK